MAMTFSSMDWFSRSYLRNTARKVGMAFFAISTQPWRESDLQSNLRDYYSRSGSPLHSGGTV